MKKRILTAIIGIALTLPLFGEISFAQEKSKEDRVKLYKEIAGDYEFDASEFGQDVMVIVFYEEDGILFGGPEKATAVEMVPVEGEEMKFEASTPDGGDHELTFIRDEETKKITKCIWKVIMMDVEVEGIKVKDGNK
jgi:hypothetical protein